MSRFAAVNVKKLNETCIWDNACASDTDPNKIYLNVDIYCEENSSILPVIRKVQKVIDTNENLDKEYLPALGVDSFNIAATRIILGANNAVIADNKIIGVQTMCGIDALRFGAEFIMQELNYDVFYNTKEAWENQKLIFNSAGVKRQKTYRYWSESERGLDFNGLLEDLNQAPKNSVIMLSPCGHNLTGCDPTEKQWANIADIIEERDLLPFFAPIYHGCGTGDLEQDTWPIRYFASKGIELIFSQCFSKNFGSYYERVGNLTFVLHSSEPIRRLAAGAARYIRQAYLTPAAYASRIIAFILTDPTLFEQWKSEMYESSYQVIKMRRVLRATLEDLHTPGDWSYLTSQTGRYLHIGLSGEQSQQMTLKHHIYMFPPSRINLSAVTFKNVEQIAHAIHKTVTHNKIAVG